MADSSSSHCFSTVNISGHARAILGNGTVLENTLQAADDEVSRKMWLNSLYFPEMRSRRERIEKRASSPESISWVWDTDFYTWLTSPLSFYWITGSAGSGKSTLMKHICDSRRTVDALQITGNQWTVVNFFFDFNAGMSFANSVEGMLRSLLYQIIQRLPKVAAHLDGNEIHKYTLESFLQSICEVMTSSSTRVCAFIDGLDEFEGDGTNLLDVVRSLEDRAGMKICLASRPYPLFKNNLSRFPHLTMQDHNDQSIRLYTETQWISRMNGIQNSLSQSMADKIRLKARGNFLWARLATDELLRGVIAGVEPQNLENDLESMPGEVKEMYHRILCRLPLVLKLEAALLLYLILSSSIPLPVRKLYVALEVMRSRSLDYAKVLPVNEDDDNKLRLTSVLGDFVDIHEPDPDDTEYDAEDYVTYGRHGIVVSKGRSGARVKLSHETFRSFLISSSWLDNILQPHLTLSRSTLFWRDLLLDELLLCGRSDKARAAEVVHQFGEYITEIEGFYQDWNEEQARGSPLLYNEEGYSTRPWNLDQVDLRRVLQKWQTWTPLLAYALQDLFDDNETGEFTCSDRLNDLQAVLEFPISWVHRAICCFGSYFRNMSGLSHGTIYGTGNCALPPESHDLTEGRQMHEKSSENGNTIATCHEMIPYIEYVSRAWRKMPATQAQWLLDVYWSKCVYEKLNGAEKMLGRLIASGARLKSRHLCFSLLYGQIGELPELFLAIVSHHSLSLPLRHLIKCPFSTGASNFLLHWASIEALDSNPQSVNYLQKLLHLFISCGEDINSVPYPETEPIVNLIIGPYRTHGTMIGKPYWGRWRVIKFILAVKAGADPYVKGKSGNAFQVAMELSKHPRLSHGPLSWWLETMISEETQEIIQMLDYYSMHSFEWPKDINQRLERNTDPYLPLHARSKSFQDGCYVSQAGLAQ